MRKENCNDCHEAVNILNFCVVCFEIFCECFYGEHVNDISKCSSRSDRILIEFSGRPFALYRNNACPRNSISAHAPLFHAHIDWIVSTTSNETWDANVCIDWEWTNSITTCVWWGNMLIPSIYHWSFSCCIVSSYVIQ